MTITHSSIKVIDIPPKRLDEAVEVLVHAFENYPLMHYILADQGAAYHDSLHEFFHFSCMVRLELDWPLLGSVNGTQLVGVAGLTEPETKPWPPGLVQAYDELKALIGAHAIDWLERYARLTDEYLPAHPHYYLGFIGVHPDARGTGYGSLLLNSLHVLSEAHPASTGVYLDTEHLANVSLYKHFGYHVVGHGKLNSVDVWCMFRPNRAEQVINC